jgi:hypothetical protein
MNPAWRRPQTAAEVCAGVADPETFGRNLRDWQHELRKVHHRAGLARRFADPPPLLRDRLCDHGQCDAYLAAYVEWLGDRAGIAAPEWTRDPARVADRAWYDYPPLWRQSFVLAPAAFRRRGIFTQPENVISIRSGRPHVAAEDKRRKNAERQKRYRQRIHAELLSLREAAGRPARNTAAAQP